MRTVLLVLLFATALAAAGTCRRRQVRTSVQCCDGAMGSLHAHVFVRNESREACELQGVRKVTALDRSGRPIPVALSANTGLDQYGDGSPRFVLLPGREAAFGVVTQEPLYDENRCARRLRLDTGRMPLALDMGACGPADQPIRVFVSGFYPSFR